MIHSNEMTQPVLATSITKKFEEHCDDLAMAMSNSRRSSRHKTNDFYGILYEIKCQEVKKYRGEYVPGGIVIFDSSEDLLEFKLTWA